MLKTYTLYLRDGRDGPPAFEPVLCATMGDLIAKARDVLARHPECEAVDVYFGETELFSVSQDRKA